MTLINRPKRRNFAKALFTSFLTLMAVLCSGMVLPAFAQSTPDASLIRTIEVSPFGFESPAGVGFSDNADTFVLAEEPTNPPGSSSTLWIVNELGGLSGTSTIGTGIEDPVNMAFDNKANRLLVYQPSSVLLLDIAADSFGVLQPGTLTSISASSFGITDAKGMTVDPATGDLYILDASGPRIVRIVPDPTLGFSQPTVSSISLAGLGLGTVRGLAFYPPNGNFHVFNPDTDFLHEVTETGALVRTRDVALGLKDPQDMTFAPTGDQTDDAAELNLYIANSKKSGQPGNLTEIHLTNLIPDPVLVTVPNVVGQAQATAESNITGAGLAVGTVTTANSPTIPAGNVIRQNPVSGTEVSPGSAVALVVSLGPAQVTVPNVVGQVQATAETNITGASLTVGTITPQSSPTVPAGSVISQTPLAGTSVPLSSAVNLVVSTGPGQVAVPDVVGLLQATAETNIAAAGLVVGTVTPASSSTVPAGNVISQTPISGTSVTTGSAVNLVVSSGPPDAFVAELIQTIDASAFVPPSPDTAGITYMHTGFYTGTLMFSDSEVNEIPALFTGDNIFNMSPLGVLNSTFSTVPFESNQEPTGLAFNPANQHLFIANDNMGVVTELNPGADGQFGTADDTFTQFDTTVFGANDPEGITYDSIQGFLYIVEGLNNEVYQVSPGPNGIFDGVAVDDVVTSFDVTPLGITDPEGITFNPNNGLLYIVGRNDNLIVVSTTQGILVGTIDTSAANAAKKSGLTFGPSSYDPAINSLYLVDRGVDNNSDPNENDGKIYEITLPTSVTPGNNAPQVNAGLDQTIVFGVDANLSGTLTDDGVPVAATLTWSKISGPGTVTFANSNAAVTTASFSAVGDYVLRLLANDTELIGFDEVTITAGTPGNAAPIVNAGPDQNIIFGSDANLNGGITDDGVPVAATSTWSKISGPGTVTFANPNSPVTTASFSTPGVYVLRLFADDTQLTGFDEISISTQNSGDVTLDIPVNAGSDDAEERTSTNAVILTSSDLEMALDGSRDQVIGIRFNQVDIPQGATITEAYVQFQADETSTDATNLTIRGEKIANAPTFTSASGDVTSRFPTTASAPWSPAPWNTVGEAGVDQRTSSIISVIKEIVDQGGWVSGNSLVILISGTGKRVAESFNGNQAGAPTLHVVFSSGPPVLVAVPNVVGQAQATAEGNITGAGLNVGAITTQTDPVVPAGNVISQNPVGGTDVLLNSSVDIVVSLGAPISVPDVVGLPQATAETNITLAGLTVGVVTTQSSPTVPLGEVISQNPLSGTSVASGTGVDLVVSSGPAPIEVSVPNVVGQAQATAEGNITSAGLLVGTVTTLASNTVPAGDVISQNPTGGTLVAPNSAVDIVVSLGTQVTVPDVVGQAQATAESNITGAGLVVGTVTNQSSETVPAGNVISQNPLGGASVVSGTAVNLAVSTGPSGGGTEINVRIDAGSDDAEERASGSVSLTSSDLEMVVDGGGNQTIGLRFNGITIPQGATISNAYVQFQVDEVPSNPTNLTIHGENTLNALTFSSTSGNITSRSKTTASVPWSPAAWSTIGEAGPDQRTPNIASVIQQIVNQGGWTSGNSLALIISGTGERVAESYNGNQAAAPLLHVEFSSGPPVLVTVPGVVGQAQATAEGNITGAGLVVGTVTTQSSGTVPAGEVISQDPAGGAEVLAGTGVNLVVSLGAQVAVPGVVGQAQATAEGNITGAGLVVGTVTSQSSPTVPAGDVISQNPTSGTLVDPGTAVDLVVSLGAQVSVPGVVGQALATAEGNITGAGLTVGTVTNQSSATVPAGDVISQDPTGGTLVDSGSAVNLVVSLGNSQVIDVRVASDSDDAEQSPGGSVELGSSDLEMVQDGGDQTVGIRFTGVNIGACSNITNAYIQFQADEVKSVPTSLTIEGEGTANATTFTTATNDISARFRTTASVPWTPVGWDTVGASGLDQRTPSIAAIIQEIVNQGGWVSGNALAVIITGTGERVAESFDGDSSAAPLLHVEFSAGTCP